MANQPTILPESNLRILELLHTYRFLNAQQLLRLGVATQESYLRRVLKRFDTRPSCIGIAKFGVLPGKGRTPFIYYLTRYGAEVLADYLRVDPAAIDHPKGEVLYSADGPHRTATIDFQIALDCYMRYCQDVHQYPIGGEFFHRYFDCEGANRNTAPDCRLHKLSKLPLGNSHFIPDAVFAVRIINHSRYLFLLEVFRGRDIKRVHQKLENHLVALGEGRISTLYQQQPFAHRVLCLFENPSALKAAADRLLSDSAFTEPLRRQFAFSTLEGVQANFLENWHFLVPGRRTIFDLDPEAAQDGGETSGETAPDDGEGGLLWGS